MNQFLGRKNKAMNILAKLMILMMCVSFVLYIYFSIKSIRYHSFNNENPYSDKAGILYIWIGLVLIIWAVFKIKNPYIIMIFLIVGTIINIWVTFTKLFERKAIRAILYNELIHVWQQDLTGFKKCMNREEQIKFLKSVKMNKESATKENGMPIIEQISLINNDEDLKKYKPILRKEIKL